MLRRQLKIDAPLDLRRALRPLFGSFRPDGWWFASRTGSGPASLRITRAADRIEGRAWGPGGENLLERLEAISGLADRGRVETDHPLISELQRRNPGVRFGATGQIFPHLLEAIVGQKVTRREADRAVQGLMRAFSDPAPGPEPSLRLPPDPERIASAPYWRFHELHLEKKRADTLRGAAKRAAKIEALAGSSSEECVEPLNAIPGVGAWTVAKTLQASHGDPDQVEVGDFHLKNLIVYHLTGKPRGTDDEMMELLEEFRPQRGRVTRLLHFLGHAPKYGPRLAPRDITRI